MKHSTIFLMIWLFPMMASAQATDKAGADQIIYKELTAGYELDNWHPELIVTDDRLKETNEKGVYMVKGDSFQVKSIRSDFYVRKKGNKWMPINDSRYPMETIVNLLLNRTETNLHQLSIRHHQYGGVIPVVEIPMQYLYDLLARNMQLYCSVTYIGTDEIHAVLVFHHERLNYIHMLELKVPTKDLFDERSVMTGDFYTNIPQDNVNSIFREKTNVQR